MDETEPARPDVLEGFVHSYHAWFADRIRALCDRRVAADEGNDSPEHSQSLSVPFAEEMRSTIAYANRPLFFCAVLSSHSTRRLAD